MVCCLRFVAYVLVVFVALYIDVLDWLYVCAYCFLSVVVCCGIVGCVYLLWAMLVWVVVVLFAVVFVFGCGVW